MNKISLLDLLRQQGIELNTGRLDQHFLIDDQLTQHIVDLAEIRATDTVIEFGAGLGAITQPLAAQGARVVAYEIDRRFATVLTGLTNAYPNIQIKMVDGTHVDWPKAEVFVSDAPFSVIETLSHKLIRHNFRSIVLVTGRRLADLVEQDYFVPHTTRLSLMIKSHFHVSCQTIPKTVYYPEPATDAAILTLAPIKKGEDEPGNTLRLLFKNPQRRVRDVLVGFASSRARQPKVRCCRPEDIDVQRVEGFGSRLVRQVPEVVLNKRIGSLDNSDLQKVVTAICGYRARR